MKFNKKIVVESLNHKQAGKKVFTEGKKQPCCFIRRPV